VLSPHSPIYPETARSSPTCDRCAADEKVEAGYFVEYQEALMVNDPEYMAETGEAVYGWWGHCCVQCLREVVHLPELVWLEAVDLCDVIHVELGGGWQDHQPDWSKAVVRVGSRTPSKAMQRLFQACDPQDPKVCPQEALERLAVLRMLEDV
jgi:hypothetical protein